MGAPRFCSGLSQMGSCAAKNSSLCLPDRTQGLLRLTQGPEHLCFLVTIGDDPVPGTQLNAPAEVLNGCVEQTPPTPPPPPANLRWT
ncbi:hypothetical protein TREES_T100012049 [Tupaia chinensis]|uniref:Uncharacterized protein n=1 Tax=Tupaia chinensis TaxID=246437 RepID=L9KNG2_TUPCH|nr:hypothetical protein TREES_T100012049 [Tupaia chinensis]